MHNNLNKEELFELLKEQSSNYDKKRELTGARIDGFIIGLTVGFFIFGLCSGLGM